MITKKSGRIRYARAAHRWLGAVMVLPFVIWTITGFLFAMKPGWGRAYDWLDPFGGVIDEVGSLVSPASLTDGSTSRLELVASPLGPVYRVWSQGGAKLFDARSGAPLSPLSESNARALVLAALEQSPFGDGYGTIESVNEGETSFTFQTDAAVSVKVDRMSGSLKQRGADTDRIDWLYRMHYLQFTESPKFNRVLLCTGLLMVWALALLGGWLWWRSKRFANLGAK
jgi:hypothetical protein